MTEGAIILAVGIFIGLVFGFTLGAVARGAYKEPDEKPYTGPPRGAGWQKCDIDRN